MCVFDTEKLEKCEKMILESWKNVLTCDRSAPSFKRYIEECKPKHAIRFSKRGYRKDGDITNIPLYLVSKTKDLL